LVSGTVEIFQILIQISRRAQWMGYQTIAMLLKSENTKKVWTNIHDLN
jgi:hypothetical protein